MIIGQPHSEIPRNRVQEEKISLINILTCLICANKAEQAHICPHCSKFYCQHCIRGWLEQAEKSCPNCHRGIEPESLVNCNKLSQDLSKALEALIQFESPAEVACQNHSLPLSYYCQGCKSPLCSDCIILEDSHKGHTFLKIKQVKVSYNQKILSLLSKLRSRKNQIEKLQEQVNYFHKTDCFKQKMEHLEQYMSRLIQTYNGIATQNLAKQHEKLLHDRSSVLSGDKSYQMLLGAVQEANKVKLIKKTEQQLQESIQSAVKEAQKIKINRQSLHNMKNVIGSSIRPHFTHKSFVLDNYSLCREKKQVIYSDVFYDGTNEWRLKIYPNGLDNLQKKQQSGANSPKYRVVTKREQYISIYIQLKSGPRAPARYRHNIQIANQIDPSKVISQTYECQFEIGQCWGYDHFANITSLYQEGYVHPKEDCLMISVWVGSPSYYHACLDKQALIDSKHQQVQKNRRRIEELKKLLKIEQQQPQKLQSKVEIESQKSESNFDQYKAKKINIENRCEEDIDHQSRELKKIYRRIERSKSKDKNLLYF